MVFRYLRGIDGVGLTREPSNGRSSEKRAAKEEGEREPSDTEAGVNPTGGSQRDYLRRIERSLLDLHRQQQRAGGRGILAIGVVGTDVYDKLLILRAVHGRFPRACFFTTDLDAELVRPSELPFTRNMIVVSHFGLTLHPSLQREVAPFRDSYETATYLAALLAIGDQRVEHLRDLPCMARERGQREDSDFVLLADPDRRSSTVGQDSGPGMA